MHEQRHDKLCTQPTQSSFICVGVVVAEGFAELCAVEIKEIIQAEATERLLLIA